MVAGEKTSFAVIFLKKRCIFSTLAANGQVVISYVGIKNYK